MIADADPRAPRPTRADVHRASPPIFASPALDRLTRVHASVPVLLFGPLILWFFALDYRDLGPASGVLWPLGGYLFWTLCEYWAHRSVFHLEPKRPLGARMHWIIHGVHHDHPNDPRRLVLPPVLSIPLAALFFLLFVSVMGRPTVWGFAAGFYGGYLVYDMVHFALHHMRPKNKLGRRLHELHMRHHFEDEETGFGVSAPWWDVVFGTKPRRSKSARAT
jgi:sterol desaturase/sphingolipid hydroxylase (fatty acid hydroxylase superfamily)